MSQGTEMEKLRVLLPHWINHNVEHADEFRRWAEGAAKVGPEGIASDILAAAQALQEANESLTAASHRLGRPPESV